MNNNNNTTSKVFATASVLLSTVALVVSMPTMLLVGAYAQELAGASAPVAAMAMLVWLVVISLPAIAASQAALYFRS